MSNIAKAITGTTMAAADLAEWQPDSPRAAVQLRGIAQELHLASGRLLEAADELDATKE